MRTPFTPENILLGDDDRWYHDGFDVTEVPLWWHCHSGHHWQAPLALRTRPDDVGCPTCWAGDL